MDLLFEIGFFFYKYTDWYRADKGDQVGGLW